uniref:A-kinase anchor protein 17A n=1 Tax=Syphacia muris TaxID=451379 RepID=A0A0N5ADJ3_9BILA
MNEVPHSLLELEAFCVEMNLYLKPYARINITVPLPQLKQPGQSISNWDLMEKIKKALSPIQLSSIKVTNSTIEMVRFEAELANRKIMSKVIKALDGCSLKVVGFFEPLKVRVAEAKSDFPTRHDWDEFFRNADDMDELKAGERPDTIYLAKIPTNWFTDESESPDLPSAKILQQVFEQFGKIRCIDIPLLDKYRKQMSSDISGIRSVSFSFGQDIFFEAYIQFYEYISFVRAMDTLRNMKLVRIMDDNKMFEAAIKVEFDKTRHLSEKKIQKRDNERRRLRAEERRRIDEEGGKKRLFFSITIGYLNVYYLWFI